MPSVASGLTIAVGWIDGSDAPGLAAVDLTDDLDAAVIASGIEEGCAVAFCRHTTATLVVNEWEDGALEDFRNRMIHLVPDDLYYADELPGPESTVISLSTRTE